MDEVEEYREWAYRELNCTTKPHFRPYAHQQSAWRALEATSPPRRALIVLPTGACKTKTAVRVPDNSSYDDPFKQMLVIRNGIVQRRQSPLPEWVKELLAPPGEGQV